MTCTAFRWAWAPCQVNENTQNNYTAIEQVASATQENSAGVEEIENMVERIKELANSAVEKL